MSDKTMGKDMVASVHYTGTLPDENNDEFDTSKGGEPLQFLVGHGQMIPGFEEEMMGASVGESRIFTLDAERAYGARDDDAMQTGSKSLFPDDIEIGSELMAMTEEGQGIPVVVTDIGDEEVTIDMNHKLAGKKLTFEVELVELRDATDDEISHGHAHGPGGHHH